MRHHHMTVVWLSPALYALCNADTAPGGLGSAGGDFSDFGPLPSFTPMVGQQAGRSHPFAPSSSSNGYIMDRSSLRTSQDISLLLRSGMLMEAALLSSNASRMHVIHDAGRLAGYQRALPVTTCSSRGSFSCRAGFSRCSCLTGMSEAVPVQLHNAAS